MTKRLIVEKLGVVSLRNGLVFVQCLGAGADGKEAVVGELAIPLGLYGHVAGSFQAAGKQLQEKLKEIQDKADQKDPAGPMDAADQKDPVIN